MAEVMPGNHLVVDAGGLERGRLFGTPGEHERVAALEPHDLTARQAVLHQQRVDLVLGHRRARSGPCRR